MNQYRKRSWVSHFLQHLVAGWCHFAIFWTKVKVKPMLRVDERVWLGFLFTDIALCPFHAFLARSSWNLFLTNNDLTSSHIARRRKASENCAHLLCYARFKFVSTRGRLLVRSFGIILLILCKIRFTPRKTTCERLWYYTLDSVQNKIHPANGYLWDALVLYSWFCTDSTWEEYVTSIGNPRSRIDRFDIYGCSNVPA